MGKIVPALVIGVVLALPCHAATLGIGPSVGFDEYGSQGESFMVITAPGGTDVLFGGLKPGLRLALRDATTHHTIFTDVSLMVYSGSGTSLHAFSGTLNYA